jgi:hypothetical protein
VSAAEGGGIGVLDSAISGIDAITPADARIDAAPSPYARLRD